MILNLLKDPIEADDKVEAIHNEAHPNETDQRDLFIAERSSHTRRAVYAR